MPSTIGPTPPRGDSASPPRTPLTQESRGDWASPPRTPLTERSRGDWASPPRTPLKGIPYSGDLPATKETQTHYEVQDLLPWPSDVFEPQTPKPTLPEPLRFKVDGHPVEGHWADDLQHASYPSSQHHIRTFVPVMPLGQVASLNFPQLLQASSLPSPPSKHFVVTPHSVQQVLDTTGQARQQQLQAGTQVGDRVVPKDASLNPSEVVMFLRSTNDVSTRYAQQLSEIGAMEGFHVVAGISSQASGYASALSGYDNISLMQVPGGEVWVEDYSEPTVTRGQVVPAVFDDPMGALVSKAIREGRQRRYQGTGLAGDFAYHGAVNQGKYQKTALARGTLTPGPLRQALSYLEGGNLYSGTRPNGEGYALVGKDSLEVTQKLLESQTQKPWTEAEVVKTVAADLGLSPANVVPVEQPGAFHLDMRLTSIAPGVIVLNDSRAACEQQLQWLREAVTQERQQGSLTPLEADRKLQNIEQQAIKMRKQAEKQAAYEAMTAQDLEKGGFTVHRLGGCFVDPDRPSRDSSNYFNSRHFTNEQGQRVSIFMGGQPHEEAYVAQKMLEFSQDTVSRIHFLDPSVTQKTLDLWGGFKCRTKPEGDLISPELLAQPAQSQVVQA